MPLYVTQRLNALNKVNIIINLQELVNKTSDCMPFYGTKASSEISLSNSTSIYLHK